MEDHDNEGSMENQRVCSGCVGEDFLKEKILASGTVAVCDYCDTKGRTISLGELADEIETVFDLFYIQTSSEPEGVDYLLAKEGLWQQPGAATNDIIADITDVSSEIADDLHAVLSERYAPAASDYVGESHPFDGDSQYDEKLESLERSQHSERLEEFERKLKEESRYFSPQARQMLADVFSGVDQYRAQGDRPIVVDAGPGTQIDHWYRCRVFQDSDQLRKGMIHPDTDLGSPPRLISRAGRMNAFGVSVFYGSNDPNVALAEVRPPVGSRVLVGKFNLLRPLRLLDLTALSEVAVTGSLFDPRHRENLERARFLKVISSRMTMPVLPDHETFEYLATQAIADYLANEVDPPLDGILFSSAQVAGGQNVVLFNKASRVKRHELPEGSETHAWFGYETEDGYVPDYAVSEDVPPEVPAAPEQNAQLLEPFYPLGEPPRDADFRSETLAVDLNSLKVLAVTGVRFDTESHDVRRMRSVIVPANPDF